MLNKKQKQTICCWAFLLIQLLLWTTARAGSFTVAAANLSSQTSPIDTCYRPFAGRIFEGLAPDVIAIQEFNTTNNGEYASRRDFIDQHLGTNYQYYVEPDSIMPNGIISRWPILDAGTWDDPELSDREFVWATIQLPTNRLLHVISLHIKAGTTDEDVSRRVNEAHSLTNFIATAFSPTNFIALCGDFNLVDRREATLHILTNDFPCNWIPRDQQGYKDTNRNRQNPFDWVMANPLLDSHSTTTVIAGVDFPYGAIFDSRLWETPPAPILTNDSVGEGIQHMLVMRTFSFAQTSAPPTADTLALYTFEGGASGTSSPAQSENGISASTMDTADGAFSYLTGDASSYAIRETGWDAFNTYFTFTIQVQSGYRALIDSLEFSGLRGSTGPTRWSIRSSMDGYSSDLDSGDYALADAWSLANVSLGFDLISGQVTFRIYGFDADTAFGNLRIDDVTVQGSVSQVEVFRFSAFALTNSVMLRWVRPSDCGLPNDKVRIAHSTTAYPTNQNVETAIDLDDGSTVYQHTCEPGVTRYYTLWVHDGTNYIVPPGN
jgi:endonuclease/exonuclease/phosphatase family metal-dependent hydrolase